MDAGSSPAAAPAALAPTLLEVAPATELVFRGPFTAQKSVALTLRNITDAHVAYKVKTTAPKLFLVRPNAGIIPPNGSVEATGTSRREPAVLPGEPIPVARSFCSFALVPSLACSCRAVPLRPPFSVREQVLTTLTTRPRDDDFRGTQCWCSRAGPTRPRSAGPRTSF